MTADPREDTALPARIGRYPVLRELGRGGMGVVYQVRDPDAPRDLALKLVRSGRALDAGVFERFEREAQVLAKVRHPGVVRVHTVGQARDGTYLVMDLVDGQPLAGPWGARRAAELVRALADAVAAVHALGIVHRDLKPENVLVRPDGSPVLLDFGLAHELDAEQLTRTGQVLGTIAYMAPEQARGRRSEVGPRADVYSLGVILFHLLTGERPYEGAVHAVLAALLSKAPPPRASERRAGIPPDLDAVAWRAMAKDPRARYEGARALRDDLDRFLRGERPLAAGPSRRGGLALAAAVVAGAALLGAAASRLGGSTPATATPPRPEPVTSSLPQPAVPAPRPARDLLAEVRGRLREGPRLRLARLHGRPDLKVPAPIHGAAALDRPAFVTVGRGLHVWDVETGQELASTPLPSGVRACAAVATGQVVTVGAELLVWELDPPRLARRLAAPRAEVPEVVVSADGARALVGSDGEAVRLLDTRTWTLLRSIALNADCVALSPDGRVAYLGLDQGVVVHDLERSAPPVTLLAPRRVGRAKALAAIGEGRLLAAHEDGVLFHWDVAARGVIGEARLPLRPGVVVASRDGALAVVARGDAGGSEDAAVRVARVLRVDPAGPLTLGPELVGHTHAVTAAAFVQGGPRVVTVSADGSARVFDASTGALVLGPEGHAGTVLDLAVSPDGGTIATGGADGTVRLWDRARGAQRDLLAAAAEGGAACVVELGEDGDLLTGCADGTVRAWTRTAAGVWGLRSELRLQGRLTCATRAGAQVVVCTEDGQLRVWDPDAQSLREVSLPGLTTHVTACATLGRDLLLAGTADGRLAMVNLLDGRVKVRVPPSTEAGAAGGRPTAVQRLRVAAPMGRAFAGLSSGALLAWSLDPFDSHELSPHAAPLLGLALDADVALGASSSQDGDLRVWRTADGQQVDALSLGGRAGDAVTAAAFAPDDGRLLVGTQGGELLELELRR